MGSGADVVVKPAGTTAATALVGNTDGAVQAASPRKITIPRLMILCTASPGYLVLTLNKVVREVDPTGVFCKRRAR